MKVKDFTLKNIADQNILVPLGTTAIDFNGVVTLNDTAKFMWEQISGNKEIDETLLTDALIKEYEIDKTTAEESVKIFIDQMKEAGCIE